MSVVAARRALTQRGWTGPVHIEVDDRGLIAEVAPFGATVGDVSLVPGFIDVQVNGIDDIDVARARDDDWSRLDELLLDQGVTAWCPTLVTAPLDRYAEPLQRIADAQHDPARRVHIVGAHLEGPFLGGAPGAHPRELLAQIDLGWLAALPDIVRLVTLAPELLRAEEAIALLADRDIVVSLGHSTPSVDEVAAAIEAGASMATHLFNGMSGVHHRDPGLAAVALVDERLTVGLIADLVHVHPIGVRLAFAAKSDGQIALVTDAVAWRRGTAGEIGMSMRDGAPRLPDGTLAGSAVTMDQSIRNVVSRCRVPLERAVRAASTTPARLMGCDDRGEIAVGRRADLVALDEAMNIVGVWVGGAQVR